MRSPIRAEHWNDANGNPAGGTTSGNGFAIGWQNGPLVQCVDGCVVGGLCAEGCTHLKQNGAFVEDIIEAAADRIRYYEDSRLASCHNAQALMHLGMALECLDNRTKERKVRKVEGTHAE